jgi:hypothetical protein
VKFRPMSNGDRESVFSGGDTASLPEMFVVSPPSSQPPPLSLEDLSSQELKRSVEKAEEEKKRWREDAGEEEGAEHDENKAANVDEVAMPLSQKPLVADECFDAFAKAYEGNGTLKASDDLGALCGKLVASKERPPTLGPSGRDISTGLLKVALFAHFFESRLLLHPGEPVMSAQRLLELLSNQFELNTAKSKAYRTTLSGEGSSDKAPWGGFKKEEDLNAFMGVVCPLEDTSRNLEVFEAILKLREVSKTKKRISIVVELYSHGDSFRLSNFCCDLIIRLANYRDEKRKKATSAPSTTKKARTDTKLPVPVSPVTKMDGKVVFRTEIVGVDFKDVLVRRRKFDLFLYAGPFKETVDDGLKKGKPLSDIVFECPSVPSDYFEASVAGELTKVRGRQYYMSLALPVEDYVATPPETSLKNGVLTVVLPFKPSKDDEFF